MQRTTGRNGKFKTVSNTPVFPCDVAGISFSAGVIHKKPQPRPNGTGLADVIDLHGKPYRFLHRVAREGVRFFDSCVMTGTTRSSNSILNGRRALDHATRSCHLDDACNARREGMTSFKTVSNAPVFLYHIAGISFLHESYIGSGPTRGSLTLDCAMSHIFKAMPPQRT